MSPYPYDDDPANFNPRAQQQQQQQQYHQQQQYQQQHETAPDDEHHDDERGHPETQESFGYLPKVVPISFVEFVLLSIACAIPAAIYVSIFTKIGYGLDTYYALSKYFSKSAYYIGLCIAFILFAIYLMDIQYWNTPCGRFATLVLSLAIAGGACVFVLVMSGEYPYGPISLFAILTPVWLVLLHYIAPIFRKVNTRTYISWLSGPLLFVSFVVFLYWFLWTFVGEGNEYSEKIRVREAERSGCAPNFDGLEECEIINIPVNNQEIKSEDQVCFDFINGTELYFPKGCDTKCTAVFNECANTFIIWVGPLLVGLTYMFLGFVTTFLRSNAKSAEAEIYSFAKFWMVLVFLMWVAASLSGAGSGVSTTLMFLTMASFIASGFFFIISLNDSERTETLRGIYKAINAKYGDYVDVARGLLLFIAAPILLLWVYISMLKQSIRKCGCGICFTKPENASEWVTENTAVYMDKFYKWDRAKIYSYAVYWGILFMVFNVVVSKFTVLFLSILVDKCKSMNLFVVTGILVGVGVIMFLLPPVPGVPIYLTLGIVIIPVGREKMGWDIPYCMLYAVSVSLLLKLFACTLQQKMIGEPLKNNVSVRQMTQINSSMVRSMKLILAEPGLGAAKCSILVGGPDWPTSVLCGIMGLPLIPVLVGTLPVFFLIAPTMLTGSFTYMANLKNDQGEAEYEWAGTATTICAAITGLVQFGAMVSSAYYLEQAVKDRKQELQSMPYDEEVRALENESEALNKAYEKVTEWDVVPTFPRITLILAMITQITSCYLVMLVPDQCFATYALTDTIANNLDGKWTNFVLPWGRVSLLLFVISCILMTMFTKWANKLAAQELKNNPPPPEDDGASLEQFNEQAMSWNQSA